MHILIIFVFIVGYAAIALEHTIKVNKTATAILTGILCWTLFMFAPSGNDLLLSKDYQLFLSVNQLETGHDLVGAAPEQTLHRGYVSYALAEHLGEIAQILFFLMGAMTIVELVDAHQGFGIITDRIKTKHPAQLLWIIGWITFFLSSVLDNLTTTIVMVSLARRVVPQRQQRLLFTGMIIIAANAGGAWTPIGDVTTTMLWIGGQITTLNIMQALFLPSVACMAVPLVVASFRLKKEIGETETDIPFKKLEAPHAKAMLYLGVGALISVPVFKTLTHMPPYCGMLFGLAVLWIVSEFFNPGLDEATKKHYTVAGALSRIDVPSVLFFLGILLAVGALESMQVLHAFAHSLENVIGDNRVIITLIGLLSAVVDNVPLVAASMGMYDLASFPADHMIWEYLAYCAGTGGSILIIGSAAGVAAMGMEKIDFVWYARNVSLLALAGYMAGAAVYLILS